ncbi:phage tail tape measure protein [Comamonas thiooxydans]|uniref:phage tail tape measure protein n=1 Tax=Comamonas thiooxydans TaxID=363952 RepID=UPI002113F896|nr:phage tail tape measure protein [Comamonas thiooxydans]UUE94292.1 phage tail tape measure protein [Comamonas thiooxydans]
MSDTDRRKVQIEASLDATGVREGADDALKAVKGMANGMESEGQRGARGMKLPGEQSKQTAAAMSRAEKSMVGSIQRATAAMQSGGKAGADYYDMLAKQRGISGDVLKPYIDQLRQAEAAQKRLSQSGDYVMSDRAKAAALRGVPAQFQDIIVSLQGGQNALTVTLQQGSQLMTMLGGASEAAKALGAYTLGLINPLTLAAAAAGVLAYGYYSGAKEAQAFLVVLTRTNNQVGASVQQLVDMSAAMDDVAGITQGKAAEALVIFAGTAGVAADRLQRYTTTAIEWERATGQSVDEVAKDFKKLADDPVKAVLELNKQMGFLTAATFEQIKSLQEAGRETDAARVAQDAYDKALAGATTTITANLGYVERGWRAIKGAIAEAIDEVKKFGRDSTTASRLTAITGEMAKLQKEGVQFDPTASFDSLTIPEKRLATLKAEEVQLQKNLVADTNSRKAKKAAQDQENALIDLSVEATKYYDKQTQKRLELEAAEQKYGAAAKTSAEAQKQYDTVIAGINKKFEEKEKKGGSTAPASRRLDLSAIQNAAREEVRIIDGKQKDLERLHQSGLIDDQGYYSQRRSLIEESSRVEEAALQEQITRLQQEKVKGSDALAVKKQISDTESKLAAKQLETGGKLKALSHEESLALDRQRLTMEALAASHHRAMEQMLIQQQRTVSSAWMGSKDRQRAESLWGIEDSYLAERRRLEDQRMFTPNLSANQRQEIEQRLANLEIEKAERLRIAQSTYAELDSLQSRWELGAGFALQNYVDQASNVAQQTADAFTNAFKGMEDAAVNWAMTGKGSIEDVGRAFAAELVRMQLRAAAAGLLGSFFGSFGSVGNAGYGDYSSAGLKSAFEYSSGGYTGAGGKYEPAGIVHKGEYVINAESTKRIGLGLLNRMNGYANGGLVGGAPSIARQAGSGDAAGGDVHVAVTVDARGSSVQGDDAKSNQLGKMIGSAVREVILQEKMPGGMLS